MSSNENSSPISVSAVEDIVISSLSKISVKGYRNPADKLFYAERTFTNLLDSDKRAVHYDLLTHLNYVWNGSYFILSGSENNYTEDDKNTVAQLKTCLPSDADNSNPLITQSTAKDMIELYAGDYLSKNVMGDPFATKAELLTATQFYFGGLIRIPQNEDTVIVVRDETQEGFQTRYVYQKRGSEQGQWIFRYRMNDRPFEEAQLNALNSTITKNKVDNYTNHINSSDNPHNVTQEQVGLDSVVNTGDSDIPEENGVQKFTTGGAYNLKKALNTTIEETYNELDQKIDEKTNNIPLTNLANQGVTNTGKIVGVNNTGNLTLVESAKKFINISKIDDYYYSIDYNYSQLDYRYVEEYCKNNYKIQHGACSCVYKNRLIGRNFDWYYTDDSIFKVTVRSPKYNCIGHISGKKFTKEFVEKGEYDDKYKILPLLLDDVVNNKGLWVSILVVPNDYGETRQQDTTKEKEMCSLQIASYCALNYDNILEAFTDIKNNYNIYSPRGEELTEELHFIGGDKYGNIKVLEFINNNTKIIDVDGSSDGDYQIGNYPYITNFHLWNTTRTNDALDWSSVEPHGQGLERYNLIQQNYNSIQTRADMINLMSNTLKYTQLYTKETDDPSFAYWKTELCHNYGDPYGDLTINSSLIDYAPIIIIAKQKYQNRSRSGEPDTWETCYSTTYSLTDDNVRVKIQEQDKIYSFDYFNKYDNTWKKDVGEGSVVSISNALNGGQALGNYSIAEGYGSDAKGNYSHAEGMNTIAQNQSEHAEGQYNKSNIASLTFGNAGNTIYSIGIGTGAGSLEEQDRKNAIEVMQNGDIYIKGIGNYMGTNFSSSTTLQDIINDILNRLSNLEH